MVVPPGMNVIPKVIRMKELKIRDYYTISDKDKDEKAVALFFGKDSQEHMHLDGVKMIANFC